MGGAIVPPHYFPKQDIQMKDIIIFDGVCNFCNGYINFVIDHDKSDQFRFAHVQSEVAQKLFSDLKIENIDSIILIKNGQYYFKSDAIFEMLPHLNSSIKKLYFLKFIPKFLRNYAYDFIAKHRYLLMGKLNECRLPTPTLKAKFLV
jgi:predicted DCC family thiol-disulfide oxidoreductase YuxK